MSDSKLLRLDPLDNVLVTIQTLEAGESERGRVLVEQILGAMADVPRAPLEMREFIVGTICGGSHATSGITANPGVGRAFDRLVREGASGIFEETSELIGCEAIMAERAVTPELGNILGNAVAKAAAYHTVLGHGSFATGNAEGGLTTQEEKSMGAYAKSGASRISELLKPGDVPPAGGLYLLDVVPDGEVRFGFPNINDNAEIAELIACGSHVILFTTGRGSVVGSAISPVGTDIFDLSLAVARGAQSKSEALLHQEFVLTYKSFEPIGPSCLPRV